MPMLNGSLVINIKQACMCMLRLTYVICVSVSAFSRSDTTKVRSTEKSNTVIEHINSSSL